VSVVRIPTVLRPQVGGNKELELAGGTVGEVVAALTAEYPSLKSQLLTAESCRKDGALRCALSIASCSASAASSASRLLIRASRYSWRW